MKRTALVVFIVFAVINIAAALTPQQELMVGQWKGNLGKLSKYQHMEFRADGTIYAYHAVVANWRIVSSNGPKVEITYLQKPNNGKKETFILDYNALKKEGNKRNHYAIKKFDGTKITHGGPSPVFTGYWIPKHPNFPAFYGIQGT